MNRLKLRFALRVLAFGLPYAVLMVLGLFWLAEHKAFLPFVVAASSLSALQWLVLRWIRSRPLGHQGTAPPSKSWPPAGENAWAEVDRLAAQTEANMPPFNDSDRWRRLFREVFDIVAKHFHPNSRQPALEVPITQAIKIVELVARDLRRHLQEQVPAADQIKIHHVYRVVEWGPAVTRISRRAWDLIRLGRIAWNPAGAIVAEAGSLAGGGIADVGADLPAMAAGYCVRQTGRYAIDLYSGQLDLDDPGISAMSAAKPLKIVVLGQAKAGKSSLINAIFGAVRAATDVLPCTDAITPYVLERDGLFKAVIYDTIGLGGKDDKLAQGRLDGELQDCDLVIAVSSAATAAREPDRELLDEARMRLAARVDRALPPIVVAVSRIDLVRPINEWSPPYDYKNGESTKERNIRDATRAVADDLQIPLSRIVPVCLRHDAIYNVEEALLPTLIHAMPEAERAKLLRILMEDRDAKRRDALKHLLIKAGVAAAELVALAARRC
jgi:predicted GTPase